MNSLSQRGIAGQRGNDLGAVALHNPGHVLLQSGYAGPYPYIHDVYARFEVLPQPFDRIQLRARGRQPDQDDLLWELHALGEMRWGLVLGEGQDSIFSVGDEVVCRITGQDKCHLCIEPLQPEVQRHPVSPRAQLARSGVL